MILSCSDIKDLTDTLRIRAGSLVAHAWLEIRGQSVRAGRGFR